MASPESNARRPRTLRFPQHAISAKLPRESPVEFAQETYGRAEQGMIVAVFLGGNRRYRVRCCEDASASSPGCRSGTYAFVRVTVAIAVLDRLCRARGAAQQSSASSSRPQLGAAPPFRPQKPLFNHYCRHVGCCSSLSTMCLLRLRDCDACCSS